MKSLLALSTGLVIVCLFACQQDAPAVDGLTAMENTFHDKPDKENGEALVAAYETSLDTTSDAAARLSLLARSAIVYFKIGSNAGLRENFGRIVRDYPEHGDTPATTQRVLDTLLRHITDPETLRLVPGVAREYMALTELYAQARPDDPRSPEMLYKAGEIARSVGAYQEALSIYSTIENYFPRYEKAPKAAFMQAFIHAEDLQNEDKARELYQAFIAKYPEDDFVDDAQMLLETLGKSDEEIFQQLGQ